MSYDAVDDSGGPAARPPLNSSSGSAITAAVHSSSRSHNRSPDHALGQRIAYGGKHCIRCGRPVQFLGPATGGRLG
jgi:hypothetical protein